MSWYSDGVSSWYSKMVDAGQFLVQNNPMGANHSNSVEQFFNDERKKADLRGAEITSFLSGLPLVGNFIKGFDGINQLEDLYNNSGKVPEYPAVQNSGASALGKGLGGISRKIENGTHDLYQFYTGDKDDTIESLHEKGIMKYGDEI